jgi:hypothetical protein
MDQKAGIGIPPGIELLAGRQMVGGLMQAGQSLGPRGIGR